MLMKRYEMRVWGESLKLKVLIFTRLMALM